jgi:hypothetical protein
MHCTYQEINTLMEQLYPGLPLFSIGSREETVIADMAAKVKLSNIDPQMTTRCQEMEGTTVLNKIINHNRIMPHQDQEKEEILCPWPGTMGLHKIIHHNRIMLHQDQQKEEILCPWAGILPREEWVLTSQGGEIQYLHIRATTTQGGREIILPNNKGTSPKEIRVVMYLLHKGILWEPIAIMVLHRMALIGMEQLDIKSRKHMELLGREQVLAMSTVTKGMEKVKGSHKMSRGTGKESKGPMHREDQQEVTR